MRRIRYWLWVLFAVAIASPPDALDPAVFVRYPWLVADLTVAGYGLLHSDRLLTFMRRQPVFIAWCGLAILSSLWSQNAVISFYHGIQLLLTALVAALLCVTQPLEQILQILLRALLACVAIALAQLAIDPHVAFDQNGAFKGVVHHKNEFGGLMALLLLTSACLLPSGRSRALSLIGLVAGALILPITRSGTALVATLACLGPFCLATSYLLGRRTLLFAAGASCIAGAAVVAIMAIYQIDAVSGLLAGVGKDATLTGRTILWQIGWDAFLDRPLLGYGFKGYWENTASSTAIYLRIAIGQQLTYFHNNYLEVAVAFGVFGPLVMIGGLVVAFGQSFTRYLSDRSSVALWPPLLIVFVALYAAGETPLFINHSLWQFLFFIAVGAREGQSHPSTPVRFHLWRTGAVVSQGGRVA